MELIIQITGIFCGILFRSFLPFLRKWREGKIKSFDRKFIATALSSSIFAFFTTFIILNNYTFISGSKDIITVIKLFSTSMAFGYGWNGILNEAAGWLKKPVK